MRTGVFPGTFDPVTKGHLDIVTRARKVLDRMIELEDFNEAMELLRAIIKLQDDIHEQTRERQKQKQ